MKKLGFEIPDYKKVRVIIDTDAACEADDPFAIAQALLSPKLIVKGILAEHFNCEGSVQRSYEEIETILDCMELTVPVLMGEEGPLGETLDTVSEAARFIRDEAMREDDKPLFILCQGAITNVAAALRKYPEVIGRMTVIWIGTHGDKIEEPPFREFNAGNDVPSANFVLSSGVDLWLVPSNVYCTVNVSIAELVKKIYPCGRIGRHLVDNLVEYNKSEGAAWTRGESWSLGDSPAIMLAIDPAAGHFHMAPAPVIGENTATVGPVGAEAAERPVIRVYDDIDSRYILEDLFAKLALAYGE